MLWLTIVSSGVMTFVLRWSFIALIDAIELPAMLRRALQFVPAAVLAAIICPLVVAPQGTVNLSLDNLRLVAALFAALVAWRTRNIFCTIAVGMTLLWALRAVLGNG